MMNMPSHFSDILVIDANIAVWAVVPVAADIPTLDRLQQWHQQQRRILAPDLWLAEATSVIRMLVYKKLIALPEAKQAVDDLFHLEIQTIPLTRQLCQTALSWASKLQQARAYDSLYLALTEQEQAWFWTADQRLVNGARQHGFSKISWIGEDETAESNEQQEDEKEKKNTASPG